VVVFLSTCDGVDFHYALLTEFELQPETNHISKFLNGTVFRLHGNMKQDDRAKAFQGFKTEKSALLLSTDVAARGLDFPRVRCIIQYDSPGDASEYVHRYSFLYIIFYYFIKVA
jgi:ATP-dependent RNA helicase DDX31/DBP7